MELLKPGESDSNASQDRQANCWKSLQASEQCSFSREDELLHSLRKDDLLLSQPNGFLEFTAKTMCKKKEVTA